MRRFRRVVLLVLPALLAAQSCRGAVLPFKAVAHLFTDAAQAIAHAADVPDPTEAVLIKLSRVEASLPKEDPVGSLQNRLVGLGYPQNDVEALLSADPFERTLDQHAALNQMLNSLFRQEQEGYTFPALCTGPCAEGNSFVERLRRERANKYHLEDSMIEEASAAATGGRETFQMPGGRQGEELHPQPVRERPPD